MSDPHVQQAYRVAVQFAVQDDPTRAAEMIQRIRTLDRHGSVPSSELAILSAVAAVRSARKQDIENAMAAIPVGSEPAMRRLREYLLSAPEASQPGFRAYVDRITAPPQAPALEAARRVGGRAAALAFGGLLVAGIGFGAYFAGGRADLWPLPRWLEGRLERPEEALREWIIDVVTFDLIAGWNRMPKSWRDDSDAAVAKLLANLDPKLLVATQQLLDAQANLLEKQRAFIEPEIPPALWFASGDQNYDGLIAACRSLADGPLLDSVGLSSIGMGELIQGLQDSPYARVVLGPMLADQLIEDLDLKPATLRRPDVRDHLRGRIGAVVQSEGTKLASVRLIFPDGGESEVEMMFEEGVWVPEGFARAWEEWIADLRRLSIDVRTRAGEDWVDASIEWMNAQRQELDRLSTARTKEEFDAMVEQMPIRVWSRLNWW